MANTCHYCGDSFEPEDLRPYGPGGSYVCYPCGTLPEHEKKTERSFRAVLQAAGAMSPDSVVVFTNTGIQPGNLARLAKEN